MRIAKSLTLTAIAAICGCSSFSATINPAAIINDAGTDGGDETGGKGNTGGASATGAGTAMGGSSTVGGGTSTGGSSTAGGGTTTGGSSTVGGGTATGGSAVGGVTSTGGNSTAGGISSTGGSSTGGASTTGGASACSKDADCVNPDPVNCSYTCVNPGSAGVCKPAALLTPTKCATAACDDKAISGFWDAQGKPHIAYGYTETDGTASIRMQQLKLDGSVDGAAVPYKLATSDTEPGLLSAAAQGSKVALLWTTSRFFTAAQRQSGTDFATTDITGISSTPAELASHVTGDPSGDTWLNLQVTSSGAWLALTIFNAGVAEYWNASSGSSIAAWSNPSPLVYEGEFAFGVVGNTLMLTGSDCASVSGCQHSFQLQRFSAASLAAIGSFVTISPNFQRNVSPAMGPVSGKIALLWTETQSPGALFRTLINEDGTFAMATSTVQSAISPKAIVQASDGGALLIGTIASGAPAAYQLIVQELDANLNFIGNPLPVADRQSADATGIETRLSGDDTEVLVTFHQNGAKYRVLSTTFCR